LTEMSQIVKRRKRNNVTCLLAERRVPSAQPRGGDAQGHPLLRRWLRPAWLHPPARAGCRGSAAKHQSHRLRRPCAGRCGRFAPERALCSSPRAEQGANGESPGNWKARFTPQSKERMASGRCSGVRHLSRELFEAAHTRKGARSITHPNEQRRPRHMLSGLLQCGACAAGMSTSGKDTSRRQRFRRSADKEGGKCPDPKTFYRETVEKAVLDGLMAEIRPPHVMAEYVRTYHEERGRLATQAHSNRIKLQRPARLPHPSN
jgi:Recombinase zinc beta ribbon domain